MPVNLSGGISTLIVVRTINVSESRRCVPALHPDFAGVKIRARLYFDTTIEANPATPEFGTANGTLFSNIGRSFSAFPVLS
jgi:hypothetical protein